LSGFAPIQLGVYNKSGHVGSLPYNEIGILFYRVYQREICKKNDL